VVEDQGLDGPVPMLVVDLADCLPGAGREPTKGFGVRGDFGAEAHTRQVRSSGNGLREGRELNSL